MPNKYHPFDSRLEHRAIGAAALTATTTLATVTQRAAQRTCYLTAVHVESIDIAGGDEKYTYVIEVSNDSFTTVEVAAILTLGHTSVRQSGAPTNAAGDMYELLWTTEVNGKVYKDWRIRMVGAGASFSIGANCHSTVMPGA